MAITFVSSTKIEDTINKTTRTIDLPIDIQNGDFILIAVGYAGGSTTNSVSGLSGLVELGNNQLTGISAAVYYKQNASSTDAGSTVTITTSSSLRVNIVATVFRGVRITGNPFDVQASGGGAYSTAVITPSTVTTAGSSLPIQIVSGSRSDIFENPWAAPESISEVHDAYTSGATTGNSGLAVGWSTEVQPNTPIGGDQWIPPGSVNWSAWTLSLDSGEATDAPTVTVTANQTTPSGENVILSASATGGSVTEWEWSQLSGPPVTLLGSDSSRTFIALPYKTATTLVFGVRAYNGITPSNQATTTVTIQPHHWWQRQSGDWTPLNSQSAVPIDPFALTSSEDTPNITYHAVGASASPTIAGSAGWLREKRIGQPINTAGAPQTATTALDIEGDTRFHYGGVPFASDFTANPGQYVSTGLKPGGGSQNANWLFNLEFQTSSPTVEIRLNSPTNNPRLGLLLVNGRLVSETALSITASAGAGVSVKLSFSNPKQRRITIIGLNHNVGRFGGVAVEGGYTVEKPARPRKSVAIIGDSWVNGAHTPPEGATAVETFAWRVAHLLGATDFIQAGIGGTGWIQTINDEPESVYAGRIADVMAMNPDMIILTGGRNDSAIGLQDAVESSLDSIGVNIPRYIVATNAPAQSAQRTAMELAANRKGVPFCNLSDQAIELGPDGVHPTFNGHKKVATLIYDWLRSLGSSEDSNPDPGDIVGTPSEGLFFELPVAAASSPKKVFAHFFGPYPISIDNQDPVTDYYARNYLDPNGEGGIHASKGGFLRNRPMGRSPLSGDWKTQDASTEIEHARQAGIDGFFVDIMGITGNNWDRYVTLADTASSLHPGFYIVPMIDTNGAVGSAPPTTVADKIAVFANRSSSWTTVDGRYGIGSFKADGKSQAWWQDVFLALQSNHGIDAYFFGVYSNFNLSSNYTDVTDVASTWGSGADPNIQRNYSNMAGQARARGEKWMAPVWWQDIRPPSNLFDEACNTESLRESWLHAIRDDADFIQLCTWSDYSEGSEFNRSVARGAVAADLSAYYIAKLKTGSYPAILRDAIYLSHRSQLTTGATYTGGQTEFMTQWERPNRSAVRDMVETLTFFTAPAEVTVKIGSSTYTYTAPAGMHAELNPLENGNISVSASRSGSTIASIASPVVVTSTPVNQDRGYYSFSSLRGTDGQYRLPS